ncbi:MAG: hypothetical protein ACYDC1_25450, partial [Limisphaerales bacterium]
MDKLADQCGRTVRGAKVSFTSREEARSAARAAMLWAIWRDEGNDGLASTLYHHGAAGFEGLLSIGRRAATDSLTGDASGGFSGRNEGRRAAMAASRSDEEAQAWAASASYSEGEEWADS